ncbi:MAG TPA: Gfo/Idh/MocA family oxidoreductase [Brevefilum sp.]|nr:Gfo/Idh/MocA family oxidoreductase [Brevefilum sp.]HOR18809.1 Gfo/Idh/MocA family oxidoreductase [Brevefilum sp.]HPL68709.1 Gfo/Idh/MocA family oxidoreductase [Brevefilum sp.]
MDKNNKEVKIGLVGYGISKLLGWSFLNIPRYYDTYSRNSINIFGVCTESKYSLDKAVRELGCEFITTKFEDLIYHPEIDAICVGVPDYLHFPVVDAAIKAGKPIYCEKPLTKTIEEAKALYDASLSNEVFVQMGFQMRFGSAIKEAKKIISNGGLGELYSFRCNYQHSGYEDPLRPISWRLDGSKTGGGALYDLGSHAIDMIMFLLGDISSVVAKQETYIKSRPLSKNNNELQKVNVDDITFSLAEMKSGVIGSLEATRLATGLRQGPEIVIHGSLGTIKLNGYTNPHVLEIYWKKPKELISKSGFENIIFDNGAPIPLEVASTKSFLDNLHGVKNDAPTIEEGYKVQEVLAAIQLSNKKNKWSFL